MAESNIIKSIQFDYYNNMKYTHTIYGNTVRIAMLIGVKPTKRFQKRLHNVNHKGDPKFIKWKAGKLFKRLLKYANKKMYDTAFVSKVDIRKFYMSGVGVLPPDKLPPQKHYILDISDGHE